jgi:MoaA/NifB/PqqE/SkfB family radical SAM enzyme
MHDTEKYTFRDGLSSEFPSQLILDITEVCNLACVHCPQPVFKKSKYYAKRYLSAELNEKMVREVRDEAEGHCKYIRYTSNGEPLVHPDGYKMIKYAVDNANTFVCLTTNGTIMNERKTRKLLDSGIHMIDISLDAFLPETYSKIRVGGNLEKTRDNVLRLLDWVRRDNLNTKVLVSFVEQPENTEEIEDFKEYWTEQGATKVLIRRLHSAAGAVENIAKQMHHDFKDEERYPCLYPWERLTLDAKGHLSFCPTDWKYKATFADYRETTIKEAWQGEFLRELRSAHVRNNFSCHKFCGQCPDWKQTRWPGEGGRYANVIEDLKGETL